MAVSMTARWDNNGTVIPGGDAEYVVAEQPIAEYDNWFNYNIVADIQAVIDDVINKFNANTILKADTDNTPAALAVAEQTIVGRKTGSSIGALVAADVRTILNVENGATADQTGAEIKTVYEAEANAFTDTKNTKLTGIGNGADVTGDNPPQSHGASSHTDRMREMFITSPHHNTGGSAYAGITLDDASVEYAYYTFKFPTDFVSLSNIYIYYHCATSGGNVVLSVKARYGGTGQSTTYHGDDDLLNVMPVSNTYKNRFTTSGLCGSMVSDDTCYIIVQRDALDSSDTNTGDLIVIGVLIEYVSDM